MERRAAPRLAVTPALAGTLADSNGAPLGVAVAEEVSTDGLRLLVNRPQPSGQVLSLSIGRLPRFAPRVLRLVVTRCEPEVGGGFFLGARLTFPLSEAEAANLAGP
jgi:hypothetical protein